MKIKQSITHKLKVNHADASLAFNRFLPNLVLIIEMLTLTLPSYVHINARLKCS